MKRWFIPAVALIVAVSLPGLLAAGGDAKAGKEIYAKRCASCHGPNGEGNKGLAKALKVELRDLGSKKVQTKTDAQLRKDTVEGVGKMHADAL